MEYLKLIIIGIAGVVLGIYLGRRVFWLGSIMGLRKVLCAIGGRIKQ